MQLNWKTIIKNIGQNIGLALLFFMATAQADTANLPQDQRTGAQPPTSAPPQTPAAKENRKRAYLRYIEAQRMKSLRTTKVDELVTIYKEIIQLDPTAADPHAELGELYFFSVRDLEKAEQEGLEAVRLDPNCLSGQKLVARLYTVSVRFDKQPKPVQIERAIKAYEEVARLDPGSAEAWAFQADLWQMKGDQAHQLKALEKLSTIASPSPMEAFFYRQVMNTELSPDQTYFQLSQLYLSQGKTSLAIESARKAFEIDPESTVNARNLMNMLRLSSSGEEELNAYTRLLKKTNSPLLQIGYGAALVRVGRYPEAITKLRDYLKSDPNNAGVIELLASALRRSGKRAEAAELLKQAIPNVELSGRQKLSLELGETYEELGRPTDAIAYYEGVFNDLANKPKLEQPGTETFIGLVARLTRTYNRQGDKKKSQSVMERARQVLGESSLAVDSLTIDNLREEGKPREALEAVKAAQIRNPNNRALNLTEALILSDLHNYSESLELLRGMLKGNAVGDTGVLTIISIIQTQGGQLKEAETTITKALEIDPNDTDLLIQLGSIQDKTGQKSEAEKTFRTVLQREPDNATALNNLGYFLAERNARYQEALPLIEKAVSIEPLNGSFLDSLGWVQYKLGRLQEARGQLEKAASYTRRNATVYEHLGDVLRDLGRLQEAKRNWESALEYSVEAGVIARLKNKLKTTQ